MCKNGQGVFLVDEKMGNMHFLFMKDGQGAFLAAEKQAGCILGERKMGRVLHFPKNA